MPDLISPFDMVPADTPVPDDPARDLSTVRDLVLRAHPDVVPELVSGDTIADLIASIEPAREAFQRLAASIAETRPAAATVPAGGGVPIAIDPDRLPAAEKIRRGLAHAATQQKG